MGRPMVSEWGWSGQELDGEGRCLRVGEVWGVGGVWREGEGLE